MSQETFMLTHRVTTSPAAPGSGFYVEAGRDFDATGYASAHAINVGDIRPADVEEVRTAAANLKQGEWLFVTHETTGSK